MRLLNFISTILLTTAIIPASAHVVPFDGPYVMCTDKQYKIHYLVNDHGKIIVKTDSFALANRASINLTIQTDIPGQTFNVKLKEKLEVEKAEFKEVSKQFVVSDIEGNFKAFRSLLQANQIIDANFNWTFGNGHLVLTGDFVDRGDLVNEVLWLIYSLEEKAKAAGGYVHFVLGNHEIMNLSGDIRYVNPKYLQSVAAINEEFVTLYGDKSELGQWLRTKNVMEVVGKVLYAHAGISPEVNKMDLSITKINKLVRPHYDDSTGSFSEMKVEILYSDLGPFWYRGYYTGEKATEEQVEKTLKDYRVNYIATGHTIISDKISSRYNGKVYNTDVHHAKGISEGLFIDGDSFYRATLSGQKIPFVK